MIGFHGSCKFYVFNPAMENTKHIFQDPSLRCKQHLFWCPLRATTGDYNNEDPSAVS